MAPLPFAIAAVICLLEYFTVSANVFVLDTENKTIHSYSSEPALFGPSLPDGEIAGHLLVTVPVDACANVSKVPPDGSLWIALIKRQTCTFANKVYNVQLAGYKAAIVHNVGSDELIPMKGDDKFGPILIPSVFVGESSGIALSLFAFNFTVILKGRRGSDNTVFLMPFAIVIPLCAVIMCCFLGVRYVIDHFKKRRSRLSKSNLKKLPIKKFKKGDECEVCAICLEEYEDGDKLRELPCAHAYHQKCIDPWLTKNKQTCPLCNKKVFPREDDSDMENGNEENRSNENTPLLTSRGNVMSGYGISVASRNNTHLMESDSDDISESPDELLPTRVESRVEVHAKPVNFTTSAGAVTLANLEEEEEEPSGRTSCSPTIFSGATRAEGIEQDNAGFGFDEEHFSTGKIQGGNSEQLPVSKTSDPLQVEIRGIDRPDQSGNSHTGNDV